MIAVIEKIRTAFPDKVANHIVNKLQCIAFSDLPNVMFDGTALNLTYMFQWSTTPEGEDYWDLVNDMINTVNGR